MKVKIIKQFYESPEGQKESYGVILNGKVDKTFYDLESLEDYMREIGAGVEYYLAIRGGNG